MGLRPASRYPSLFVDNLQTAKVGDIVGPLRSGAGFPVLKVLEKRQGEAPTLVITQTRARHILLRPGAQLTSAQAQAQLVQIKQKITSGQTSFAAAARELSQFGIRVLAIAPGTTLTESVRAAFTEEHVAQIVGSTALRRTALPLYALYCY